MDFRSTFNKSPIVRALRRNLGPSGSVLNPAFKSTSLFNYESTEALQQSTLGWIRLANRTDVDASEVIEGHAEEHRWFRRRLLKRFAERLSDGMSLVDAVEQTPGVVSKDDALAIRFGQQNGTLNETLDRLSQRDDAAADPAMSALRRTLRYVRFMAGILLLYFTFNITFIYPVYKELILELAGMDTDLTETGLQKSIDWSGYIIKSGPTLFLTCITVILVTTLLIQRRGMQALSGALDRISGSARTRESVFELIADAAKKGRPMIASVSSLARYHNHPRTRQSLLFARNEMDHGVQTWQSLQASGLLSNTEQDALALLSPNEDAWLLRQLASRDRRQRTDRRTRLVGCLHVVAILGFAVIVGWLAYLTFFILAGLVHAVA